MRRADVQQTCTNRAALFFIAVVVDVMVGTAVCGCATLPDTLPMPMASSRVPAEHLSQYSDLAVEWLEEATYQMDLKPFAEAIRAWASQEITVAPPMVASASKLMVV